ncbi:MAG: YjbQ family protein [Candidatus Zixiibacteriota bacterium]|nr:MAG: YjbQ family protein [candidate division Zixibacteria bacterium]
MATKAFGINVSTSGDRDIIDLTPKVAESVGQSEIKNGIVLVFVPGATAAITTIEYEPGLLVDLPEFFERILPSGKSYHHDRTWGDGNGYAHLRSALIGASFTCPLISGKLVLGTWQQIVLLEFDNRPRQREIVVQIQGE